jgi:hypothetical protein
MLTGCAKVPQLLLTVMVSATPRVMVKPLRLHAPPMYYWKQALLKGSQHHLTAQHADDGIGYHSLNNRMMIDMKW